MKVYYSYELRWFSENPLKSTEAFFRKHNREIIIGSGRTDRYLINHDPGFSLKVREGRLELKIHSGVGSEIAGIGTPAWWTKWSYDLSNAEVRESFEAGDYVDVEKDRTLLFTNGNSSRLYPNSPGDTACQLEYGLIRVGGREIYTFGLEAFAGNRDDMKSEFEHGLTLVNPVFTDLAQIEPADYPDLLKSLS